MQRGSSPAPCTPPKPRRVNHLTRIPDRLRCDHRGTGQKRLSPRLQILRFSLSWRAAFASSILRHMIRHHLVCLPRACQRSLEAEAHYGSLSRRQRIFLAPSPSRGRSSEGKKDGGRSGSVPCLVPGKVLSRSSPLRRMYR